MLSADGPDNFKNREISEKVFYKENPELIPTVKKFVEKWGRAWIKEGGFQLAKGLYEIDIIRDVVIPLDARLAADLFYFDLRTEDENTRGTLSYTDVYKHLLNIRVWGANNNDPAQAWNRRRWAAQSAQVIIDTTTPLVKEVADETAGGFFSLLSALVPPYGYSDSRVKQGSLRSIGRKIVQGFLASGMPIERIVDNAWLNGFGAVGNLATMFAECLEYFLKPGHESIWASIQDLAAKGDDAGIRRYVLEAQRLTTRGRNLRIAMAPAKIGEKQIAPGNAVLMLLVSVSIPHV